MLVGMRLAAIPSEGVFVLMMSIVVVTVSMGQKFVTMLMPMHFSEVQ